MNPNTNDVLPKKNVRKSILALAVMVFVVISSIVFFKFLNNRLNTVRITEVGQIDTGGDAVDDRCVAGGWRAGWQFVSGAADGVGQRGWRRYEDGYLLGISPVFAGCPAVVEGAAGRVARKRQGSLGVAAASSPSSWRRRRRVAPARPNTARSWMARKSVRKISEPS